MMFIKSIAPVLAAGVIAVAMVFIIKKQHKTDEKAATCMAEGVALGLCFGAAIVSSMPAFLTYFISLGSLLGLLIGMRIKK